MENKKDYHKIRLALRNLGYRPVFNPKNSTLPECSSNNTLISISERQVVFTLDDLAEKLNADVQYHKANKTFQDNDLEIKKDGSTNFDIIACLSHETLEYFEMQNEKKEDTSKKIKNHLFNNIEIDSIVHLHSLWMYPSILLLKLK